MRDCRVCGKRKVKTKTGPATCPACRRERALEVKRRYQQSEKGQATARAREQREDVREKRRQFSRSYQGKRNHAKYEATDKGKATRQKALAKYKSSEKARQTAAAQYQRTKDLPTRIAQKAAANARYQLTEKMKAKKRRDYARRKAAIVAERPVTAEDWLEIVAQHKNRCHYCGQRKVLTLDHVIPVSKGGKHVKENIVPACKGCNSKKKDRIIRLA
jgi:5-methylcytosine-specific restriction endonuclease McrA